ncbi:hypothetical protein C8R42DRAFT_725623 [Lentinula raphanica]|nr:hypothetical protein C8R42DRAFT_725623 [Lentinula raphanica]
MAILTRTSSRLPRNGTPTWRTRASSRSSRNGTPTLRTAVERRRLSPNRTLLGPSFNGMLLPELENQVTSSYHTIPEITQLIWILQIVGSTVGLYFGHFQAIAEKKRFDSTLSSRSKHERFIDVRDGFSSHTDADDIYKIKVLVDNRRYFVCGTYDQSSPDTNGSLKSYNVNERFKGDIVIFFYTVFGPERFLEGVPKYKDAEERVDAIGRVLTALVYSFQVSTAILMSSRFTRNVRNHIENNATLYNSVRG